MSVRLDHLVVAARTLADGVDWGRERLGSAPAGRGWHEAMGTHNALWGLGAIYLEVIAIDPEGRRPDRPRWFGLDDPEVRESLAAGPRLVTWAVAVETPAALARFASRAPEPHEPPQPYARDDLRWHVALPSGRGLPLEGAWPLAIAWTGGLHPAKRLPDGGMSLAGLRIAGSTAATAEQVLGPVEAPAPVEFASIDGPTRLAAEIETPRGRVAL